MSKQVRKILGSLIIDTEQKLDQMFKATQSKSCYLQDDKVLLMLSEQLLGNIKEYNK